MPPIKHLARVAVALGLAIALSGCVVYPAGPYYHPHRWGYYY